MRGAWKWRKCAHPACQGSRPVVGCGGDGLRRPRSCADTTACSAAEIAERLRPARSTVARWPKLLGLGRLGALMPRPPVNGYQSERPGELIPLDIQKLRRFSKPCHRVTGQRKRNRTSGAGWEYVYAAIDDAPKLAYAEVLPDEKCASTTGFMAGALR